MFTVETETVDVARRLRRKKNQRFQGCLGFRLQVQRGRLNPRNVAGFVSLIDGQYPKFQLQQWSKGTRQ